MMRTALLNAARAALLATHPAWVVAIEHEAARGEISRRDVIAAAMRLTGDASVAGQCGEVFDLKVKELDRKRNE